MPNTPKSGRRSHRVFSKDAVLKGSFDKYAETTRSKRGTAEVDAAFLQEIETWRDLLARNLAIRNPRLSQRELNFAVQRTIDRIIFLRICEDRGIEPEGRLLGLTNAPGIYGRLLELYRQADERYNSGLFHFRQEKGRAEEFDRLTPGLTIEDKVAQGHSQKPVLPRQPVRVLRPSRRHPRAGVRAVPRQGDPPDRRAPGQGRGQARGEEGGRRLLHAHVHRGIHRPEHRGAPAGREDAERSGEDHDPRSRLRVRFLPPRRISAPARLAPGLVRESWEGEIRDGETSRPVPGDGRGVAAHHGRTEAHPARTTSSAWISTRRPSR